MKLHVNAEQLYVNEATGSTGAVALIVNTASLTSVAVVAASDTRTLALVLVVAGSVQAYRLDDALTPVATEDHEVPPSNE